ncbi:MAG: GNAT family N-acetyltransferase [Betaproteobacteria bacterium]|nr:GNAT family N-acetyltransferase [Betaproteobacteria bacterium]
MQIVTGSSAQLPQSLRNSVGRYRHRVFVEKLEWSVPSKDGIEADQFDRPDTVYVVGRDGHGHVCGCARLLPTTRPYLLGEVFPQLLNGLAPPASPDVWELSRFAATDFNSQATSALGKMSSEAAIVLMRASIACAAEQGAKRLIMVTNIGVERLLRRSGFQAHRAGPPTIIGGHPIFACWILCS